MASMFLGLNTAYTGLLAANAALNTTAQNISNAETVGYSRQQVVQTATEAIRSFTTYGCVGAGVDVISIERMRDEFYDTKYWENASRVGEYTTKKYYYAQLETYFSDNEKVNGFNTVFQKMYAALDEVLKNPADGSVKEQFISFADNFTDYFNNMSVQMQNLQRDLNEEIKIKVDEISSISQQIGVLNQQINTIEVNGNKANELRDRRANLVDQLSEIVKVEVRETPIYDQNGVPNGCTRFMVNIAGGINLVDQEITHNFYCRARELDEKVNQSDIDGLYDIYWDDGNDFNIYNTSIGGTLKSLLELRDGNNGEYFHGTVTDVFKSMYTDSKGVSSQRSTIRVEVQSDYLLDFHKTTLPDEGVIRIDNKKYDYDSFSYIRETDKNGESRVYYEFILERDQTVDRTICNNPCTLGGAVHYQGIPYFVSQMNEWCRSFAETFNRILTTDGVDGHGDKAMNLFVAKNKTDEDQFDFGEYEQVLKAYEDKLAEHQTAELRITNEQNSYYRLTCNTFDVKQAMLYDSQLFATHTSKYDKDSTSANDITQQLIKFKDDTSMMSFRGCTASDFLKCVLSDVALNANSANTFSDSYQALDTLISNQRTSIQGVDNDEEAMNLVKYQNAYNLSSKMIQTLTEVYDRLILQTGV